eukprot:gene8714-11083_t
MDSDLVAAQDLSESLKTQLEESVAENRRMRDMMDMLLLQTHQQPQVRPANTESYFDSTFSPHRPPSNLNAIDTSSGLSQPHFLFQDSPKWNDLMSKLNGNSRSGTNSRQSELQVPESPPHSTRQPSSAHSKPDSSHDLVGLLGSINDSMVYETISNSEVIDEPPSLLSPGMVLPKPWKQLRNSDGTKMLTVNPHRNVSVVSDSATLNESTLSIVANAIEVSSDTKPVSHHASSSDSEVEDSG